MDPKRIFLRFLIRFFPEVFHTTTRARYQREPTAKRSLMPERASQDGPPRIFLRFLINFFLRFFKKTARESQREPQDCCQKSQEVPQNARKCRRVPEKRSRVPERARGHR